MRRRATRARRRLDISALAGIPVGVGLVLAGQAIEGGAAGTLVQAAAGLIVAGGTLGAVLVSFSAAEVGAAFRSVGHVFSDPLEPAAAAIGRLTGYAAKARRLGLLAVEGDIDDEPDPFLQHALSLVVEGISQNQVRSALEVEIETLEEVESVPARVYEAAGGYAPTVGILGAVLGLIHVMENLADPSRLGPGIATAFVATVYGVGSANLVLLPISSKLRQRAREASRRRELLLEGALAIQEGVNPRLMERRLNAFAGGVTRQPLHAVPLQREQAAG